MIRNEADLIAWVEAHPNGGVIKLAGTVDIDIKTTITVPPNTWVHGSGHASHIIFVGEWWLRRLIRWMCRDP